MTPSNRETNPRDPQPWSLDSNEGERRKGAAHLLLEAHRESYLREGRRALLRRLLENGTATADDVRAAVELPEGVNPTVFGAVPPSLVRAGIIRSEGFTKTCRPEGHARPITVWRLVDGSAAERWLAAHPPMTELTTGADLASGATKRETPAAATADVSTESNPNN